MSDGSPRTSTEPMAFTRTEFLGGALRAWLWAVALLIAAWTAIIFPGGMIAAIYVLPASVAALVVFVAPAWGLGRALRRVARVRTHVLSFAAFGGVIGACAGLVFRASTGYSGPFFDGFLAFFLAVNTVASAAAVALGWWGAARRALRPHTPSPDPDAAAEDALPGA